MGFTVLSAEPFEDGTRVTAHVPPDSPYFKGHFPRQPVLPAVALLDLIALLGSAHGQRPAAPCRLEALKLRGTIEPGAHLELRLQQSEKQLRFTVREGDQTCASGRFDYDCSDDQLAHEEARPESLAHAGGADSAPPPLPHSGPAHLLEAVLGRTEAEVTVRARFPADSPFRGFSQPPVVTNLLAVELAAQASAAHEADEPGGGAAARAGRGFLVNVRSARFATPSLPADEALTVVARRVSFSPPLRNYAARVLGPDGDLLAAVDLGTWVPE